MPIDLQNSRAHVAYTGFIGDSVGDHDALILNLLAPIIDELQAEADGILEREIKPNWPVKPKHSKGSRDAWRTELQVTSDPPVVEVRLVNPLDHVRFIRNSSLVG